MRYVYTLAVVCALAFQCPAQDEVNKVGTDPDKVVERAPYDIGIQPAPITDPDAEVDADPLPTPEGKAEKIVVIVGPNCPWCDTYKAVTLAPLKLEGYTIEIYDLGKDKDRNALKAKYSNIKYGKDTTKVNLYRGFPTTFYIRDDQIIKKHIGHKTAPVVRETLWQEGQLEDVPLDDVRRKFPWNK